MSVSVDVSLPRDQVPVFPARCVGCGEKSPDRHVTVWTSTVPLWVLVTGIALLFSRFAKARVPACRPCAWRLRFRRLLSAALMIASVLGGIAVMDAVLGEMPRLFRRLIIFAGAMVTMAPFLLWEMFHPPVVSLSLSKETLTYEFRNPDYAEEFGDMNAGVRED